VTHVDRFVFWRWARQALGPVGLLLGWAPVLRARVQRGAAASLAAWRVTVIALAAALIAAPAHAQTPTEWPVHSMDRPRPPVVAPKAMDSPATRPADAIVLFDGTSLDGWVQPNGSPARWRVVDGAMEAVRGTGSIQTTREFGDIQLHIEWRSPAPPTGSGQGRGNSGVFLMGRYEIQVLDSYNNETYADGQAGAMYGQYPPDANASKPPGEWQVYEILFHAARFNPDGSLKSPARVTVVHNGVVVHTNREFWGPTVHMRRATYSAPHPETGPISLQDHGDPVQFRNIWVRELR
jgi:hypothetical protein